MTELTTEEVRGVQLGILDELDTYCRRHGLTYYLAWGTLLGAVRHNGYIPWDDDIDLMMFRSDYDNFAADFPTAPESKGLSVGSAQTSDAWPYPYMKVSDQRTRLVEDSDLAVPIGVNVDIFPIDGHATRGLAAWLHKQEIRLVRGLLVLKSVTRRSDRSPLKRLVLNSSKLVLGRVDTSRLTNWFTHSARRYNARPARLAGVRVGPSDWVVAYEAIADAKPISFEGRTYFGPADVHAVLSAIYGDYMTLPPVDRRVSHHRFSAFWSR